MLKSCRGLLMMVVVAVLSGLIGACGGAKESADKGAVGGNQPSAPASVQAPGGALALTVELTIPQRLEWPQVIAANGNIAAWQEAVIGAEISGPSLTEVLVNVGDEVRKGQPLARINSDRVLTELEQSKAAVIEAEANLAEARLNADRARKMEPSGGLSAQQISQYITTEQTALAHLNAEKARRATDELRLKQTSIVAPDDGVISARTATVGSLVQPGQELFRLIRGNRLEWRAEVTASELGRIRLGMKAAITLPNGQSTSGTVRMIAPTVDVQTRNAIVYVDLRPHRETRAGMYAHGEFDLGANSALTVPQSAVLVRDGFNYLYRMDKDNRVVEFKVMVGRRLGNRIEITSGCDANTAVVASGVGFLTDGDRVRVVDAAR